MNGKEISYTTAVAGTSALIRNNGTLVIQDSADGGLITSVATNPDLTKLPDGSSMPGYASNTVTNYGHLTVLSGTIDCASEGFACYAIDNSSNGVAPTLVLEGGTIMNSAGRGAVHIHANSSSHMNTVQITGGTLTSTHDDQLAIYSYSFGDSYENVAIDITGGVFNGDVAIGGGSAKSASGAETLTITGGTFNNVYTYNTATAQKIAISAGAFKGEPNADYIVSGKAAGYSDRLKAWTVHTHDSNVAIDGKNATCTEATNKAGTKCSVCGTVTSGNDVIPAGHKLTKVEAKDATCTEAGKIEYYECADCDKLFDSEKAEKELTAADTVVAETDHKLDDGTVTKEPTCTEKGEKTYKCTNTGCDHTVTEEIAAAGHKLTKVEAKEADLTVVLPNETKVTVSTEALKAVTEQAAGQTVSLVVKPVETKTLSTEQQKTVAKYDVAVTIVAEFICQQTGEKIWTEEANKAVTSGDVTVKMPFTSAANTKGEDYTVLYVADDGSVKKVDTEYVDGYLVFTLEHFSDYIVINEAKTPLATTPQTGDDTNVAVLCGVLALAVAGIVSMAVLCKKTSYIPKYMKK